MKHSRLVCFAMGMLLCTTLTGCGQTEEEAPLVMIEQEQEEAVYKFGTATIDDVVLSENVRCVYKQMKDQEVKFTLGGRKIEKILVDKGDTVKKGQLLAQLSGGNLDAEIKKLEYQIKKNELQLEYADVNESNEMQDAFVSQLETGFSAEGRLESIKQRYQYNREDLSDALKLDRMELEKKKNEKAASSVYSELDGTVYSIEDIYEGATSEKDKVIMTIIDSSECLFIIENTSYAPYFHEGQTVDMSISASAAAGDYELLPYNMEGWSDALYFSILSGPDVDIAVGTSGTVKLVKERKDQVLSVSIDAVYAAGDDYYVYVLGNNGMREVKWITAGLVGDTRVEVLDGLAEGDKVILR